MDSEFFLPMAAKLEGLFVALIDWMITAISFIRENEGLPLILRVFGFSMALFRKDC